VNQVAILFDYDSLWAIRIKPFSRSYSYQGQVQQIYAGLAQHGIGCDVVGLSEAIRSYAVVILPTPVILSEEAKRILTEYVRGGGTLLTNFLAGIKGPYNTASRQSVPAGLVELFGVRVGEGEPVSHDAWQDTAASVRLEVGGEVIEGKNHIWTESLEPQGAEVIGRYLDSYRQGEPVATRHRVGRGQAIYLGTWLEDEVMLARLLAQLARSAGVAPAPFRFPRGVEAIRRRWGDRDLFFLFNYREQPVSIECVGSFTEVRAQRSVGGTVAMKAKEVLVLTPA
jgi:beta-galactosidase